MGDFNNDRLDDVFAWDPRSGQNRTALTNATPDELSQVFADFVDPAAINGNDFSVLTSQSAGLGDAFGDDELFFWNPINGRNRQGFA